MYIIGAGSIPNGTEDIVQIMVLLVLRCWGFSIFWECWQVWGLALIIECQGTFNMTSQGQIQTPPNTFFNFTSYTVVGIGSLLIVCYWGFGIYDLKGWIWSTHMICACIKYQTLSSPNFSPPMGSALTINTNPFLQVRICIVWAHILCHKIVW